MTPGKPAWERRLSSAFCSVAAVGGAGVGVPEVGVPEVGVPEEGVPEVGVPEVGVAEVVVGGDEELAEGDEVDGPAGVKLQATETSSVPAMAAPKIRCLRIFIPQADRVWTVARGGPGNARTFPTAPRQQW
jgi:hypothetical protein